LEKAFISDESKGEDYDPSSSRTTLHRTRNSLADNKWVVGKDLCNHVSNHASRNKLQDNDTIYALEAGDSDDEEEDSDDEDEKKEKQKETLEDNLRLLHFQKVLFVVFYQSEHLIKYTEEKNDLIVKLIVDRFDAIDKHFGVLENK